MRSDGLILFFPKRTSAMKPRLPALLCALACLPAIASAMSDECRAVMRDAVLLKSAETFCFKETMAATGGLGKLADIYKRLDAPMKACEKNTAARRRKASSSAAFPASPICSAWFGRPT